MAVKTFTTEVLTSADTNTYLANSGLVYVTSATVGSGVTTVAVASCFSTTYDNYKIQWSGASTLTTGNAINMILGSTVAGYYGVMQYASYAGVGGQVVGDNNVAAWTHCAGANQSQVIFDADIYNTFKTQITSMSTNIYNDNANSGKKTGWLNTTTSYTGFTWTVASGTITGGTVVVYGYRKA